MPLWCGYLGSTVWYLYHVQGVFYIQHVAFQNHGTYILEAYDNAVHIDVPIRYSELWNELMGKMSKTGRITMNI